VTNSSQVRPIGRQTLHHVSSDDQRQEMVVSSYCSLCAMIELP